MSFGVLMFFVLLLFAVQVTYNLYTTSVVTGLAIDAARDVAEHDGLTTAEAEARFREFVGEEVELDIVVNAETVEVRVNWQTKSLFPALSKTRAFGVLDRTFEVRLEEQQEAA